MENLNNTSINDAQNKNIKLNEENNNISLEDKKSQKNTQNASVYEKNNNFNQNFGEQPSCEGSPFGKFKDVESLKTAYENLEKEFTRKSQLLSSLQKQEEQQNVSNLSMFEKKEWKEYVNNFLQENPRAKEYAKELSNLILQDKLLMQSQTPLQSAWLKFLEQQFDNSKNYLDNEKNFNQVLNNTKVRDAVIKDYLKQVNSSNENIPTFLNSKNGVMLEPKNTTPTTLEEAKELAKKIFSK